MLLLNPTKVVFDGVSWAGVRSVSIDHEDEVLVEGWNEGKPYEVLVDVTRSRVRVKVVQEIGPDGLESPVLSHDGLLVFHGSIGGSGAGRKRVRGTCVVIGVRHDLGPAGSVRGVPTRTVDFIAISEDGATHPLEIDDDPDGGA